MVPTDESGYPVEQARIISLVFETLTQIDAQGHMRPCLANSWQAEAGGRVWQFQLRAASFHSGTPLSSAVGTPVTSNLFVTFSSNVQTTQGQTIQGQYQVSPRVAVSATRDPNGGFAVDTLIKKSW